MVSVLYRAKRNYAKQESLADAQGATAVRVQAFECQRRDLQQINHIQFPIDGFHGRIPYRL